MTGREVHVRAPGKINVFLKVGSVMDDGYHDVAIAYQAVSLYEEVRVTEADDFSVEVAGTVDISRVPTDGANIAISAARLLAAKTGYTGGARIRIDKHVPVTGGMGGGSADAAATLLACDALWGTELPRDEMLALARKLGADVPFALTGGTAIGTGRGERLTTLMTSGTYHWTFALSHTGLSTPAVFHEFDRLSSARPTDIPDDLLEGLRAGDAFAVGKALTNDLEEAALSLQPGLARTLRIGREAGALGAVVSGSGPTVAFLAASAAHGAELAETLGLFSGVRAVRRAYGPVAGAQVIP